MDAIGMLTGRSSVAKLTEPAATPEQCQILITAAMRAADHGHLQPWRFLHIAGQGRNHLGEVFVAAARAKGEVLSEAAIERYQAMPLRAPTIIVVIAQSQAHPKVPKIEQQYAAAAAAQNIINAAYALGLGAIWRTGDMAYSPVVAQALELAEGETIVGFIYIGTPINSPAPAAAAPVDAFFQPWPAK